VNSETVTTAGQAWDPFVKVLTDGIAAPGPEEALRVVTACVADLLGDKTAHLKPGGLKEGEMQYSVAATVMIAPGATHNVFVAQSGFPPEQIHMQIDIERGHPGRVVREKEPLLLANTDEHNDFQQILKTSRMGSSMYVPMFWQGTMFGQLIAGSQARYSYRPVDLELMCRFAELASSLWHAHNGPDQLAQIIAA
jgi:hypothetical protein